MNQTQPDIVLTPDEIRNSLIETVSTYSTKEHVVDFKNKLYRMSDYDVVQVFAELVKNGVKLGKLSDKEILKNQEKLLRMQGIKPFETAQMDSLAEESISVDRWTIRKKVNNCSPDDVICLSDSDDKYLSTFWKKGTEFGAPSDLFFADTIPLLDCKITVDETMVPNGKSISYRVTVFDDYKEIINKSQDNIVCVGAITFPDNSIGKYIEAVPLFVCNGNDYMIVQGVLFSNLYKKKHGSLTFGQVVKMANEFYVTWYGIQIALLHPLLKEITEKRTLVSDWQSKDTNGYTKRKVKYIRKLVLDKNEIEKALQKTNNGRPINRKTLVWYVIGHWRHYQNGKKIFIHPYWKGALRELKSSINEQRERTIAI